MIVRKPNFAAIINASIPVCQLAVLTRFAWFKNIKRSVRVKQDLPAIQPLNAKVLIFVIPTHVTRVRSVVQHPVVTFAAVRKDSLETHTLKNATHLECVQTVTRIVNQLTNVEWMQAVQLSVLILVMDIVDQAQIVSHKIIFRHAVVSRTLSLIQHLESGARENMFYAHLINSVVQDICVSKENVNMCAQFTVIVLEEKNASIVFALYSVLTTVSVHSVKYVRKESVFLDVVRIKNADHRRRAASIIDVEILVLFLEFVVSMPSAI